MPQLENIRAALQRLDEDEALLDTLPVSNTRAATAALQDARLQMNMRFVETVRRELTGDSDRLAT